MTDSGVTAQGRCAKGGIVPCAVDSTRAIQLARVLIGMYMCVVMQGNRMQIIIADIEVASLRGLRLCLRVFFCRALNKY